VNEILDTYKQQMLALPYMIRGIKKYTS